MPTKSKIQVMHQKKKEHLFDFGRPKEKTHCMPRAATVQDVADAEKRILRAIRRIGLLEPEDRVSLGTILRRLRQQAERAEALDSQRTA